MNFKVKKRRAIRVEHELEEGVVIWVEVKPRISEEIDYKRLMSLSEKKGKIEVVSTDENGKEIKEEYDSGTYNAFLYQLRASISGWSDNFTDEDDKPLEFNEENQISIFEAIKDLKGMFEKLTLAFTGTTEKN